MSIWKRLYTRGGWKTHGPGASDSPGAFDAPGDGLPALTADTAMRLSAVHACVALRAEICGSLPLHLRDGNKQSVTDHDVFNLLRHSPNADQTPAEFMSQQVASIDVNGNAISIIERGTRGQAAALTPVDDIDSVSYDYNKSGSRKTWKIGADKYSDDNILHLRGFSTNSHWGAPRLDLGRQIMQAQLAANTAAMTAFRQGLKVGGFFDQDKRSQALTLDEATAFKLQLAVHALPENNGKMMLLPKGLTPIEGTKFRVTAADAQLLESRYFGIEEICRLFNVPPQLIFHSSKASSWASSIENINLFFLMYSLLPTLIRIEQRITKKLLSPYDVAKGIQPKFAIQGLLRGDMKSQTAMFQSGLQNGYLNRDEVRDLLERGSIEGGDKYTVQLNMTDVKDLDNTDGTQNPAPDDNEDNDK